MTNPTTPATVPVTRDALNFFVKGHRLAVEKEALERAAGVAEEGAWLP